MAKAPKDHHHDQHQHHFTDHCMSAELSLLRAGVRAVEFQHIMLKEYLEKHKLKEQMHAGLVGVLEQMPACPYEALAAHFDELAQENTKKKQQEEAEASIAKALGGFDPPAENGEGGVKEAHGAGADRQKKHPPARSHTTTPGHHQASSTSAAHQGGGSPLRHASSTASLGSSGNGSAHTTSSSGPAKSKPAAARRSKTSQGLQHHEEKEHSHHDDEQRPSMLDVGTDEDDAEVMHEFWGRTPGHERLRRLFMVFGAAENPDQSLPHKGWMAACEQMLIPSPDLPDKASLFFTRQDAEQVWRQNDQSQTMVGFGTYQMLLFQVGQVMGVTVAEVMGMLINSTAPIRIGLMVDGHEDFLRVRLARQARFRSHGGDPEKLHTTHFVNMIEAARLVDKLLTLSDLDYIFSSVTHNSMTMTMEELYLALEQVRHTREERMQQKWRRKQAKRASTKKQLEETEEGEDGQTTEAAPNQDKPAESGGVGEEDEDDGVMPTVTLAQIVTRVVFAGTTPPADRSALQHRKVAKVSSTKPH